MFRFRFNTEPEPEPELDLSSVQFRFIGTLRKVAGSSPTGNENCARATNRRICERNFLYNSELQQKESAWTSKKRILTNNANTSNNDTWIREKIFYPFWTDVSKELLRKLWLLEGIDYLNIKSDSWFSVQMCKIPNIENWAKICYELLPPNITVCEPYLTNLTRDNEKKKKQTKTGKQQKKIYL
ncbi:hypothetical protein C2G38_2180593 [Gigaspora rosea]|uniref:Uncharacterized protein n=1 Tax=Gigaspora rosea TaxID=44941 RepID=A0A397VBR1_9GLOM|nr:hypothetical protein C2G38_2180593 [Gigaspora rosea]